MRCPLRRSAIAANPGSLPCRLSRTSAQLRSVINPGPGKNLPPDRRRATAVATFHGIASVSRIGAARNSRAISCARLLVTCNVWERGERNLMLLNLSEKIKECLTRAADARERANAALDPSRKADLLDVELHWLRLVESYRFVEQVDRFLEDSSVARTGSTEKLPEMGVLAVTCPTTGKDFSTGILTDAASFARLSQELMLSRCPHCHLDHSWWTKDAKLVPALPPSARIEFAPAEAIKTGAQRGQKEPPGRVVDSTSLSASLGVLVRTAIEAPREKPGRPFIFLTEPRFTTSSGCPKPMPGTWTALQSARSRWRAA